MLDGLSQIPVGVGVAEGEGVRVGVRLGGTGVIVGVVVGVPVCGGYTTRLALGFAAVQSAVMVAEPTPTPVTVTDFTFDVSPTKVATAVFELDQLQPNSEFTVSF